MVAAAAIVPAFVATTASADPAITTHGVNMRAGPDVSYPQVGYLGPGMNVNVIGCVEGWQWCDVVAGPNRGWVYAGYLSSYYYDRPTIVSYGGPTLGIPLISFSIGNYWDNYYRGRPFWNNRAYWYNHRVARAPEWHAPPNWRGNEWRGRDNGRGNEWRGHDNRAHDNRGNDWRGNNDRRASSDHPQGPAPQYSGSHGRLGPGDHFHAEQQYVHA